MVTAVAVGLLQLYCFFLQAAQERFIVLSYNILADYLAMKHRRRLYFHIPHRFLDWEYRKQRIIFEIGLWSADIMCLQEVDRFCELEEELKARGYSGIWKAQVSLVSVFLMSSKSSPFMRPVIIDAFYSSEHLLSIFTLRHEEFIEYNKLGLRDNVAQICVLESTSQHDTKGLSAPPTRALLDEAYAVSKTWNDAPVVICGDFNCTPKSPLYNFVAEQKLDLSGIDRDKVSGQANAEIDTPMPDVWHPRTRSVDNSNQVPALDEPEVGAVLPPPMSQENHSGRNSGNFPSTNCLSHPQSMHSFENSCDGQQCGDENGTPRETQQDLVPEYKDKLESTTRVSTSSSDEIRCISGSEVLVSVEQANDKNYHYEGGTSVAIEMDPEQNVDTASQSVQQSSQSTVTGIISSDNCSLSFKDDDHSTVAKIISASVDVSNSGTSLSEQSQGTSSTDGPFCPQSSANLLCQSIGDDMMSSLWTSQEASITLESTSIDFILDEKMDKLSLNKLNEGKTECDDLDEDNVNSTFLSELHDSEDVLSDFGPSHLPCDDILDEISSSMVSEPAEGHGNTYDCSLWTPMEMETATGKADCTIVEHPLKLRSTYTEVEDTSGTRDSNGEPLVTSYHRCFLGTVDYIWRSEGLQTVRVLAPIPKQAMQWTVGYPTPGTMVDHDSGMLGPKFGAKWGSDHVALVSELAITKDVNNSNTEFQ
ncbi:Endonuclease/exonuclease/phosphatase [Dillenia turbinata]|uniref:Endonuclease/exonuclease/phosphatase n=1 Tax=Dillenia turbinata TaxID=194707 RepID=A0AAN8UC02_9MAGN